METKLKENRWLLAVRLAVAVTFAAMVTVNALANILPINGVNTGQVSDSYQNLFAPAGLTFAIWGLIYLLLAIYTLYQFGLFQKKDQPYPADLTIKIGILFSLSSLANLGWIYAWHYDRIILSMLLMLVILVLLAVISLVSRSAQMTGRNRLAATIAFGVYFGWITVAAIANATTLLVAIGWNRFGIAEQLWTILILLIGMLIGSATMIRNRDIAYGLVLIWAYAGILIKHLAANGFAGRYPEVYAIVIACLALLLIALAWTSRSLINSRGSRQA